MKGDSLGFVKGIYGTQGVSSPANKPEGRAHAVGWVDNVGNLWLFGGHSSSTTGGVTGFFNDLWKYDPTTNEWAWINGDTTYDKIGIYGSVGMPSTNNKPGARRSSVGWKDSTGNFWLFGGDGYARNGEGFLNDLWKYSSASNVWTWISGDSLKRNSGLYGIQGTPATGNKPPGKVGAFGFTDNDNHFWLMGGYTSRFSKVSLANDLWKYDPLLNLWSWEKGDTTLDSKGIYGIRNIADTNNKLGARGFGTSWCIGNELFAFGGDGYATSSTMGELNDLWKYNITLKEWTWLRGDSSIDQYGYYGTKGTASPAATPSARSGSVGWSDGAKLLLFGGYSIGAYNDVWEFTPSSTLPLRLLTFNGRLQEKTVLLQWISENERSFSHYEVERSIDGREWKKMQNVKCKMQNGRNEYGYEDDINGLRSEVSRLYYRLKMLDNDGKYSYSNVVEIRLSFYNSFSIYPNPASTSVQLQFGKGVNGKAEVEVRDMSGKVVMSDELRVMSGVATLATNKLKAGSYVVKVVVGGELWSEKLVIVK